MGISDFSGYYHFHLLTLYDSISLNPDIPLIANKNSIKDKVYFANHEGIRMYFLYKKSLKIPKGQSESVYRRTQWPKEKI